MIATMAITKSGGRRLYSRMMNMMSTIISSMVICTSGFSLQHTLILNHRMTPFSGGRKINLHHDCISTLSDASKMKTNAGNPYMSDRRKFSFPHLLSTVSNDVSDEMMKGISSIDASNDRLEGMLTSLREENFFRLYSVDILASCEYLPQELFECYSESCEIYPIDEDEIPEDIREMDAHEHDFELDGWARMDMPSEDYYDTMQFMEEYTGYDGADVWKFIHNRICFQEINEDDEDWKADFNKAVSGLHSMISAQIIKGIEEKIENNDLGEDDQWTDPIVEYERRLSPDGENKHAMDNMYFGYMLLLSAVSKARTRLLQDCDSGKIDMNAANKLRPVLEFPLLDDPNIGIAYIKLHDHAVQDQDSMAALWEARMRTRELMRIMNCVQCNKCRFHGKISVLGLSTALLILLGSSGEGGDATRIHRVELAALMTTLSKFSSAIRYCTKLSTEIS